MVKPLCLFTLFVLLTLLVEVLHTRAVMSHTAAPSANGLLLRIYVRHVGGKGQAIDKCPEQGIGRKPCLLRGGCEECFLSGVKIEDVCHGNLLYQNASAKHFCRT